MSVEAELAVSQIGQIAFKMYVLMSIWVAGGFIVIARFWWAWRQGEPRKAEG